MKRSPFKGTAGIEAIRLQVSVSTSIERVSSAAHGGCISFSELFLSAVFTAEHQPLFPFKQNVLVLFVLIVQWPNIIEIMRHGIFFVCFSFLLQGNAAVNKKTIGFCFLS